MAEFDDLKKSIDELRKIEAERLKMEKKEFEETAADRTNRLDKKAFGDLVKEFRKNNSIEKDARKLTDKRFEAIEKGALAKITKSSAKNAELSAAQHNLSKEMRQKAFAEATELEKAKRVEGSVLVSTGRILATIADNFLENTQVGQAILGRAIDETSLTSKAVIAIDKRSLGSEGAFKTELNKLGEQLSGKLDSVKKGLGQVRDFSKASLRFFTDPTMFVKTITSWFWKLLVKPAFSFLFKGLGFLLKLPFKIFDKLVGLFRGKSGSTFGLKRTEERREKEREGKISILERFGQLRDSILGKRGGIFGAMRTLLPLILAAAPFILIGIALLRGLKGGIGEFLKTGDLSSAVGEFFVSAFQTLTFGIVNTDEIREKIKEPFDQMIDAFRDGFSVKGLFEFTAGAGKFVAGIPDLAFKLGTGIVSLTSRLLGFDEFANEVTALFKDFNLFDSIVGGITTAQNALLHFFTGTTAAIAAGITGLDVNVTAAKIAKMTETAALDDALEGLLIARSEQDKQIRQLRRLGRDKQADKAQLQFDKILANVQTLRKRQREIAGESLEHEETVLEQVERGKQEKAGLAAAMTKEADAAAGVHKSFLQRAIEGAQSAQDAGSELFAAAAQGLSNVITNPDIASGKNLQALFSTNTDLRDKARAAITVAPITNTTITPPVGGTAIMSPPMSLRNPENTLQRVRDKDHGAAVN